MMRSLTRYGNQDGATLLIVIGIIAALAVMTATLVMVVANMQANTADTRVRDKSSGVGEAAVDGMMYQLALNWPDTATPTPAPFLDEARIGSQFGDTSEFPRPASGSFVAATLYDDSDTNGDGQVDTADADTNGDGVFTSDDRPWDTNDNDLMYVEGQGNVGKRSARFQALVRRTYAPTDWPKGIAIYCGGNMFANASGTNPKVTVFYDDGTGVLVVIDGFIDIAGDPNADPLEPFETQEMNVEVTDLGGVVPPLDTLISPTKIQQMIALAQGMGRYYDATAGDPIPADKSGLCVIRVADGTTVGLGNSAGINMSAGPTRCLESRTSRAS